VCFNRRCGFNEAHNVRTPLPFILTDDTIYARAPSVILGTIDKLAMLGQRTTTIRQLMGMFGLARGIGPTGHLASPPNEGDIATWLVQEGYELVYPAFREGRHVFFDPFPSLIIQDEAHLLEESLGTFSGLFDSLLEQLFREIDALAGNDLQVARVWTGGQLAESAVAKSHRCHGHHFQPRPPIRGALPTHAIAFSLPRTGHLSIVLCRPGRST